ncbi:MAG: thioredoxin domain-containing protein [Polyangiaceae bacterium]|nr:thioredoxin domain-containing protein [Polyangiaceae bacterium]
MTQLGFRHLVLGLMCAGASCRNQSDAAHTGSKSGDAASPSATTTHAGVTPLVTLEGVDTARLSPREKQLFSQYVTEAIAPCKDVAVSVAQCVSEKRDCKACLPAARYLVHQAQSGRDKKVVTELYKARFDPAEVKTLVLEGSPTKGPADAPITMVEFADFECGGCGQMFPLLEQLQETYGKYLRFSFKHFPIEDKHPNARFAALASIAAAEQGKFWSMYSLLYQHQDALAPANIEEHAVAIKLDLDRFRKFAQGPEAKQRLERDLTQAESLGVEGTPTIFINGRNLPFPQLTVDEIEAWLDLDLELAGIDPKPLHAGTEPAGSASAGPSAAPTAAPSGHPAP